jgi:phage baseplate assembly protein W
MDRYVGFSTLQFQTKKEFILTNVSLIKQDLVNEIYTRPGERVMMFEYGTRIPDLVFEPLDDTTIFIIEEDITKVFKNDPRVQLNELQIVPVYDQNAIMVFADVYYAYLNFSDKFDLRIEFASS